MAIRLLTYLLCIGTLSGCDQTPDQFIGIDYTYFPLQTGRFILYDVQETLYSPNLLPVQRHYQLKETTGVAYANVTGQTAYKLYRYKRPNDGQPWEIDSVWSARLVNNEAIRTENGYDYVKLLFPVQNGNRWNANRYNALGSTDAEARNVGEGFSVLGKPVEETVTVIVRDDSTLLQQDKQIEVYARQIGLIYKEQTSLRFCTEPSACAGKNQIETGSRKIVRMQTYGKE